MLKLVSLQLPEDLIVKLKERAKEKSLSMSALIRIILLEYIQNL